MLVSETLVISGLMYRACLHLLKSQSWVSASTGKPIEVIQQCAVPTNDGMTNALGNLHQTIWSLRIHWCILSIAVLAQIYVYTAWIPYHLLHLVKVLLRRFTY